MKQSIVEVIAYLLEVATSQSEDMVEYLDDQNIVQQRLQEVGFSRDVVSRAFDWMKELIEQQSWYATSSSDMARESVRTVRIFTSEEAVRISLEVRNFILILEESGILDTKMREIVITQLMQLNQHLIELPDVKWVVLLVLMSKSNKNVKDIRSYLLTAKLMEE